MSDTPLHDLALLSDRRAAALVSNTGLIEWCCLPRFDSGSCFGRLLDEERGGFCAVEIDGQAPESGEGRYLDYTLVHVSELRGEHGTVEVSDAMIPGSEPQRMARVARCTAGSARVEFRVSPRFDYGDVRPWIRTRDESSAVMVGGNDALMLATNAMLERRGDHELRACAELESGEVLALTIAVVRPECADETDLWCTAEDDLTNAADLTRNWLDGAGPICSEDPAVARSVLTLCAMVYEPTGAIIAAPTASLPETPDGHRTWDYRYSWLRDATLSSRALADVGLSEIGDRFSAFAMRSTAGHPRDMQVLYGVGGERRVDVQQIQLSGWRGAQPVRIGNGAVGQTQRDEPGEILQQCLQRHRRGYEFDDDEWRFLRRLADHVVDTWTDPGNGFWEMPGDPRHFVYPRAASYAALDSALEIAGDRDDVADTALWATARTDVQRAVLAEGFDDRIGCFVQCPGAEYVDSTALLLPHTGVIGWNDERMLSTVDVLADRLSEDGLMRRYDTDDGLPGREGTFLACSFWLAECLARQGRVDEAKQTFDRATRTASPLGLYTEEYDPASGRPLGNYPQALTHLAHIGAAVAIRNAN